MLYWQHKHTGVNQTLQDREKITVLITIISIYICVLSDFISAIRKLLGNSLTLILIRLFVSPKSS